jgi:hypothetical protein
MTAPKPDLALEELAALEMLAAAKRQRMQSKRVAMPDPPRPQRRPAVEQQITIAETLAELAQPRFAATTMRHDHSEPRQQPMGAKANEPRLPENGERAQT